MSELVLYNTLTRRKDRFVPLDAQRYAWEEGRWRSTSTAEPAH